MVKKRIRDYSVVRVLGQGGMGEVLLAEHEGLRRPAALKRFVHRAGAGDDEEQAKERFRREGQALARLSHQNIAVVYDLFEWRKNAYIALEYVDGFDLAAVVARAGPCPWDVACIVALGVARGLEAAHEVGIIHRDVKPANVMVSRRGQVKLMDFGIAQQDMLESMTRTGLVVGTPRYLAPEIVNGEPADPRSDVYGVGTLLYYILTGERLFAEAKQENLFYLITAGKYRPLKSAVSGVPRDVRRLVERCLAADPAHRFASAADLARALESCVGFGLSAKERNERVVAFLEAQGPDAADLDREVDSDAAPVDLDGAPRGRLIRGWVPVLVTAFGAVVLIAVVTWLGLRGRIIDALNGLSP